MGEEEFDADWYLESYPDIANSGIAPYQHWVSYGQYEGRVPKRPNVESPPRISGIERIRTIPIVDEPLVSIIIPVYNNWELTRRCVSAIIDRTNLEELRCEVIIADDNSTDDTLQCCDFFIGIRSIVNESNSSGFLSNVNFSAEYARGDFLIILNNDTEVQAGWLDAIVKTFDHHAKAAIVGAKLIYPNGLLQEAGCSVFRDGLTRNLGRYRNPDDADFIFSRVCDYVSGACLAIRRNVWADVGGFDPQFSPAYYEDVDLAFKVRRLGWSVFYQPKCLIVHIDGGSMRSERVKLLEQNRLKFVSKWHEELELAPQGLSRHQRFKKRGLSLAKLLWQKLPFLENKRHAIRRAVIDQVMGLKSRSSPTTVAGRPTVVGFLQSGLGIGEAARLDLNALTKLDYAPGQIDISANFGMLDMPSQVFSTSIIDDSGPLMIRVNSPELMSVIGQLGRRILKNRFIIACWAWELPTAPKSWTDNYRFIDELWVPSNYCADAFKKTCPVPLRVVPHPVVIPPTKGMTRADFGIPSDVVVFLAMSDMRSSFARKNIVGAVEAFRAACGDDQRFQLLIKMHHASKSPENMTKLIESIGDMKNIVILDRLLSRSEIGDLLRACDVFLSPHRAEGFGLVLAEAMLLGKAVIATNFSGNVDFMREGTAELIPYKLVKVDDFTGIYNNYDQLWAEPDMHCLSDAIERLSTSDSRRKDLGDVAAQYASSYFSVENYETFLPESFKQLTKY